MKNIIKAIFLSPELYILAILLAISFPFRHIFYAINLLVFPSSSEELPYVTIVALFSIIVGPIVFFIFKILFPEEKYKKYMDWAGYRSVIIICYYAIFYHLISTITFIMIIAYRNSIPFYFRFTISIYISQFFSMLSLAHGYVGLRIVLRKNEEC